MEFLAAAPQVFDMYTFDDSLLVPLDVSTHLFDVPDVPDVDGVVVVDDGDLEVVLVVGDGAGVGVARRGRVRRHVADRQTLRDVHAESRF